LAKAAKGTMKALVRDFKIALKSNGLTLSDALAAMGSDPATKAAKPAKKRAKRGSKVKIEKPYKTGVIYKRPKGTETWVGGTKGRQPAWLRELIAGGRTFESLAAKK
jgi:DNA-binding protein H-NS